MCIRDSNTADPNNGPRTVTWVVNDGSANSVGVTSTITVATVNDPPVLSGADTLNYNEGDGAQVIDSVLSITDVDDTNITGATVTISGGLVDTEDLLSFADIGSITFVSYDLSLIHI